MRFRNWGPFLGIQSRTRRCESFGDRGIRGRVAVRSRRQRRRFRSQRRLTVPVCSINQSVNQSIDWLIDRIDSLVRLIYLLIDWLIDWFWFSFPAESSTLAKSGAALVSGMKSVTSVLSKKFGEMATTLTTASPGSYSPSSRAGSSLRDIPGTLNFDYSPDELTEDQPSPDDDEDEYRGEVVDGPDGRRTWHFPSYAWSPKQHPPGRVENVLVHADVLSLALCQQCETLVYDEEIMAGWFPDESNLNTKYVANTFPSIDWSIHWLIDWLIEYYFQQQ